MSRIKSRVAAVAVLLGLAATSGLTAAPVATAATGAATAPAATAKGRKVIKTGWDDDASKRLRNKAARVVSMVDHARTRHGRYDYRKMDAYDNHHRTWRRQAAAHLLWLGKDVTHLSHAERRRVRELEPERAYAKVKLGDDGVVLAVGTPVGQVGGRVCTGWTGYLVTESVQVPLPGFVKYWMFLNSCHTNALKYAMAVEAGAFAVFGAFFPPSVPVVETVAFLEGVVGAGYVDLAQSNSGLNAILVTKDVARLALVSQ